MTEDSKKFDIRLVDNEKGKGLFAKTAYKVGDVILQENPVVCCQFAWNTDYKYRACEYCMRPLESAEENARRLTGNSSLILPFPECCGTTKNSTTECELCGVQYCCLQCKGDALHQYHETLCLQTRECNQHHPLLQLKETWKQMHYPPETTTVMLLARIVAMVNQATDKSSILSIFSQFCHRTTNDTHEIAHKLLGEQFMGQIDILREMMQKTLNTADVANWFTPDGFRNLLALVGTNGQGIGTSPFSQWVKNVTNLNLDETQRTQVNKLIDRIYDEMDNVVGTFLNSEGSGLYVLQSSINHSCLPNAIIEFPYSSSTLVVRAVRDIHPNQEICISYLDECQLKRSRHSRQKALSALYLFLCKCERCQEQTGDLNVTSDEDYDEDDDSN
ncbi:SET and MYND domain-containing protein 5 [Copidosoma floridanum]|uniref:SET and MYND domain-containing protein 5 n=1 Tax=Copidosoma floridanum TaxID=29053 RepID=UPI0006C98612|nr:SET and MYND domain-containing protein 5 [Copidosoma floridanum]